MCLQWSTDSEAVKNINHKAPSHDVYHSCHEQDKNMEMSVFPYTAEDFSWRLSNGESLTMMHIAVFLIHFCMKGAWPFCRSGISEDQMLAHEFMNMLLSHLELQVIFLLSEYW